MSEEEFYEIASQQIDDFSRAHKQSREVEGDSLYPEEMDESEWWEAFAKYRFHINF